MKSAGKMAAVLGCIALLGGCATAYPIGSLYTEVKMPWTATSNEGKATKIGTAECMSVLTLVATGDCSIEAAKKEAGITRVHTIDWDVKNYLGIVGYYKATVYGE